MANDSTVSVRSASPLSLAVKSAPLTLYSLLTSPAMSAAPSETPKMAARASAAITTSALPLNSGFWSGDAAASFWEAA